MGSLDCGNDVMKCCTQIAHHRTHRSRRGKGALAGRKGRAQDGGSGECKFCAWPRGDTELLTRPSWSPQGGNRAFPLAIWNLYAVSGLPRDSCESRCFLTFSGLAPPLHAPEVGSGGFGALLKSREFESRTRPSPCCGMSPPLASRRTREEVDATLQVAKLNAAELLPTVHCLSFGPGTGGAATGDFCLLELEPALCQQLEAGDR